MAQISAGRLKSYFLPAVVVVAFVIFPQLVSSGKVTLLEGLAIPAAVMLALSVVLVVTLPKNVTNKGRAIVFLSVFGISTIIIDSIVYLSSVPGSKYGYLLLIPVTCAVYSPFLYLLYRLGKDPSLVNYEFSREYSNILSSMLPDDYSYRPEVYVSKTGKQRSYVSATDGRNWKIVLDKMAIVELSPEELRVGMLRVYLGKSTNSTVKFILLMFSLVALYIDLLIGLPILQSYLPPSMSLVVLAGVIITFVCVVTTPLYILRIFYWMISNDDRLLLRRIRVPNDLKSFIIKQSTFVQANLPVTRRSAGKAATRRDKFMARRLSAIDTFELTGGF